MPRITKEVRIDASKEKVWEILADWGAVSNWAPTILESHSTTEATGGVGAERACEHEKMGHIEERVGAWHEGSSLSYDVIKGLPFPMKSLNNTWSVSADGDGAVVTLTMDFRMGMGPLGALPALMARPMMRNEMGLSLAGLKQYTETGEVVATPNDVTVPALAAVT